MKYLFFLFLAFLLSLSSEVSSQNPNMFDFEIVCNDEESPACSSREIYEQAGQIISNNLILTRKISVHVVVANTEESTSAEIGSGVPYYDTYGDPEDGVIIYYPTALIKQLDPNYEDEGADIAIDINSKYDEEIWYLRSELIKEDQIDFLELVLHELMHGLGMLTFWNDAKENDLYPAIASHSDDADTFTFDGIKQALFDKYLISLDDYGETKIPTIAQGLNDIIGIGNTYRWDSFYNEISERQRERGTEYTRDMLYMATNHNKLGFMPKGAKSASYSIILDTGDEPYELGTSICHFSQDYEETTEFLVVPYNSIRGKTLQEKIESYGNAPGEGIGPEMRKMLESFGYQLRITDTSSTGSKPANTESKPKRIVNATSPRW